MDGVVVVFGEWVGAREGREKKMPASKKGRSWKGAASPDPEYLRHRQ